MHWEYPTANQFTINAEIVRMAIAKTENGNSPGIDGLTTEHLVKYHPVIIHY